jgi:hypothetical protein
VDSEFISKKDLLQQMGISYGQLYRWKRRGLIPEEWFVRKSTFTGTETFFPRDKMLARIERILSMKDGDLSLDDIADVVTPDLGGVSMAPPAAADEGVVSRQAIDLYEDAHPGVEALRYGELLSLYVLDRLLATGEVSLDEGRWVLAAFEDAYPGFEGGDCDLVLVRKMGVAVCFMITSTAELALEGGARLVARVNVQESVEALGARLQARRSTDE